MLFLLRNTGYSLVFGELHEHIYSKDKSTKLKISKQQQKDVIVTFSKTGLCVSNDVSLIFMIIATIC